MLSVSKSRKDTIEGVLSDFSRWLLDQLTVKGWTQSEFARRANISTSHVSRVLSGESSPGFELVQGTARAFGVPLEDVMRRAALLPQLPAPDEADGLLTRLRRLPAADQRQVLTIWENALGLAESRSGPGPRKSLQ